MTTRTSPLRIVVLVSGSGTLLQAVLDEWTGQDAPVRVVAVGADRDGIEGLARAERAGVQTFVVAPPVLAGAPVINTHPALLPSFPGAHGVRDALAHGVRVTGTTCHLVDDRVDTGPIIDQQACRVEPEDTEDTLHERIKVLERRMLVDVLAGLAAGTIALPARG